MSSLELLWPRRRHSMTIRAIISIIAPYVLISLLLVTTAGGAEGVAEGVAEDAVDEVVIAAVEVAEGEVVPALDFAVDVVEELPNSRAKELHSKPCLSGNFPYIHMYAEGLWA